MTRSIGRAERLAPPDEAAVKALASEQTSEQAHGGRGVSAVDFAGGRGEEPFLSVHDQHVRLRVLDLDPEKPQRLHRPHAIVAREEAAQNANPVGKRGNNGGAVRDAFIAGHRHFRLDPGGPFNAKFHTALVFVRLTAWLPRGRRARRSASGDSAGLSSAAADALVRSPRKPSRTRRHRRFLRGRERSCLCTGL